MIKVNSAMLPNCSRGVRRYAYEICQRVPDLDLNCSYLESKSLGYLTRNKGVLWSPGQGGSVVTKNHIVTCHDLIDFVYYNKRNTLKNKVKYKLHEYIYRNAAEIVFISESTRSDFDLVFPHLTTPCSVIKSGFSDINTNIYPKPSIPILNQRYIVHVTNALEHKNNITVLKAIEEISNKVKGVFAVIIGNLSDEEKLMAKKLSNSVINLTDISDSLLSGLIYNSCSLISSSFIEGHNLTISESLSLGSPVIASDIDVHREFYDGMCSFFDPNSSNELADMIRLHLNNDITFDVSDKLDRTWDAVSDDYHKLFSKFL